MATTAAAASRRGSRIIRSGQVRYKPDPVSVGNVHYPAATEAYAALRDDDVYTPSDTPEETLHSAGDEVSVEYDELGRVTLIRLRCRCGEDHEIECSFDPTAGPSP